MKPKNLGFFALIAILTLQPSEAHAGFLKRFFQGLFGRGRRIQQTSMRGYSDGEHDGRTCPNCRRRMRFAPQQQDGFGQDPYGGQGFNPGGEEGQDFGGHQQSMRRQGRFAGPEGYNPQQATPSSQPIDPSGLRKAGEGGNPSFEFSAEGDRTAQGRLYQHCQATLTKHNHLQGEACEAEMVTARHCVLTDSGRLIGKLATADFGTIISPRVVLGQGGNDVGSDKAKIIFRGPACEQGAHVAVIPVLERELTPGEQVQLACRKFGTTLAANIATSFSTMMQFNYATAAVNFGATGGLGTNSGDSGGGIFVEENGQKYLAGVLSGAPSERRGGKGAVSGSYAAGRNFIDFVKNAI